MMQRIIWQSRLRQVPAESWTFVQVGRQPFGLFLSLRPDTLWRGFVLVDARRNDDLLQVRWSNDVLAEHFAEFGEAQIGEAQERLVAILAQRLGVDQALVEPLHNGRVLTTAQVMQTARLQPRRR